MSTVAQADITVSTFRIDADTGALTAAGALGVPGVVAIALVP